MRIDRFHMERTQCLYENAVRYNLSESGVQPMRVEELLDEGFDGAGLLSTALKYPESHGSVLIHERIAALPKTTPENVLVTSGTSRPTTALWGLLDRGDRAAVCSRPTCDLGLSRAYGATPTRTGSCAASQTRRGAALALDRAARAEGSHPEDTADRGAPEQPDRSGLNEEEMDAIVDAARSARAWIVADEVYRGAEIAGGEPSPTFWGRYRRVLVTSGLSKAFGLPGLRIGWIAGPPEMVARLCGYHDYTTLTPTMLSDRLARRLEPCGATRSARTRRIRRENLPKMEAWIRSHGETFDWVPPVAGAIALVGYRLPISSVALFDRLRLEESVLITPGAHFGIGKYFRVGFGYDLEKSLEGLARVSAFIAKLRRTGASSRRAADL
jgi:aspartate/methionine/tyrosine aminotransferase